MVQLFLGIEINRSRIEKRIETGYLDILSEDIDEALILCIKSKEE
jgi:urocanate hydratase